MKIKLLSIAIAVIFLGCSTPHEITGTWVYENIFYEELLILNPDGSYIWSYYWLGHVENSAVGKYSVSGNLIYFDDSYASFELDGNMLYLTKDQTRYEYTLYDPDKLYFFNLI